MSLKKILRSSRCGRCKQYRGHRFCLRRAQSICWNCCNELRVDRKCPESCQHSISQKDESLFLKTKADSQKEFADLLKKEIDFWLRNPQPVFDNQIPMIMAETEEGKKALNILFQNLKLPAFFPISYLMERINLQQLKSQVIKSESPEETAEAFLDFLLQQDWLATLPLLYHHSAYQNETYLSAYVTRLSKHKIVSKIHEYSLLSSSINQEKTQALIHFEINRKYDLTILMKKKEKWFVAAKIFGDPKHVLAENEANKQLAVLLTKKEFDKFLPLMEKYSAIFIDSADMYYYWSVYYTMNEQKEKAKEYLKIAIELDENFIDAKYNYAFLMHIENQLSEAEKWYRNVLKDEPDDVKSLNNLASILIDRGEVKEAKMLLEQCLLIKPDFEIALQNRQRLGEKI
jgi:tetratricopeptide (TPR) repeat protein